MTLEREPLVDIRANQAHITHQLILRVEGIKMFGSIVVFVGLHPIRVVVGGEVTALHAIDLVPEFQGASKSTILDAQATLIPMRGANRRLHQARRNVKVSCGVIKSSKSMVFSLKTMCFHGVACQ